MRFPMDAPVVFWWKDVIGNHQQAEGRTYDVSELGAFILASMCPPAGAPINVKISIAAVPDAPRALRMEVHGRVLRVEQVGRGDARDGFAILSDQATLHENAESTKEGNAARRKETEE